ncbi:4682_t:CDS:2, partial [Dentiscutata erythropus]
YFAKVKTRKFESHSFKSTLLAKMSIRIFFLDMNFDGLTLANRGPVDNNDDSSAMRIGLIPQNCGLLYFEVIIMSGGSNG